MAIRRGYKVNVKANLETTKSDSIFVDIKQDSTRRLRFLPPVNEDGTLFTKIVNHFKLKSDDDPPRGMAVGCNDHFKGEPCYYCALSKTLKKHGDKAEKKIGDDIRASARYYAPVLVAEKNEDGEWEYEQKVKLVGLPKTAVDEISSILVQQQMVDDDYFCDADNGQDVLITRTGTGFNTKYKISLTGMKMPLSDVIEDEDAVEGIDDVVEACSVNFQGYPEQRETAVRTFGDDLDWDALAEEYDL